MKTDKSINPTIGIIGAGSMGSSLGKTLADTFLDYEIWITDHSEIKVNALQNIQKAKNAKEIVKRCEIIILAVKPQSLDQLMSEIAGFCKTKLIVSIMAGVKIKTIQNKLKTLRVIRAMPNLAISVGYGVTGWVGSPEVTGAEIAIVDLIFSKVGISLQLETEGQIDSLTAISGSGPAYFALLVEELISVAIKFGFNQQLSQEIVMQTLRGTNALLDNSYASPLDLRQAVTSKGGTTEAAVSYLQMNNWGGVFEDALFAAKGRAEELGK